MSKLFESDIKTILSHRHDNGGDYWATYDDRIYKGNPFSTIASLGMLYELGVDSSHEAVQGGLHLILKAIREDGRIRVAPNARLYPCYTAEAARMLCRFGLADQRKYNRLSHTFLPMLMKKEVGGAASAGLVKVLRPKTLIPEQPFMY